ncbi:MAG: glycosyltransferase family 87 protein [Thermodesulfobacteriota bacterium]
MEARPRNHLTVLAGIALIGLHIALAWLSSQFDHSVPLIEKPILWLVTLELAAGAFFLLSVYAVGGAANRGIVAWVLLVGVALRGLMFGSTPILEDDYYRYLLDGAVVAKGFSPYRYEPDRFKFRTEQLPEPLQQVAANGLGSIGRINHPHLKTIYPPSAQAVFAAAYLLGPWSVLALKAVLLLFDVVTVALLWLILRGLGRSSAWVLIYWWNPVVIKEIYNSAHMDVIAVPLVLGALMLSFRGMSFRASGMLALAVGAKVWPLVLAPVVFRPLLREPRKLLAAVGLFMGATIVLFVPVYMAGLDLNSGFAAYSRAWEMNDALYMLIVWVVKRLLEFGSIQGIHAHIIARIVVVSVLAGWIVWVLRKHATDAAFLWNKCLLIMAALFLLSPAQFPWYYLWVIPFMTISPRVSLLVLNVLLPLYYLRFYFLAHGETETFDHLVVWLEYVPVWVLVGWEWLRPESSGRIRRPPIGA